MGWLTDVIGVAAAPMTGGGSLAYASSKRDEKKDEGDKKMQRDRIRLMGSGNQFGRQMGERIYGQTQETTGSQMQDLIKRRQKMMDAPSKASESIRRSGQNQSRYAASKGGSDAQRRNTELKTAMAAGQQEDTDYERRLGDWESLLGNMAGTQSALALGGAQLGLASQFIPPAKKGKFLGLF